MSINPVFPTNASPAISGLTFGTVFKYNAGYNGTTQPNTVSTDSFNNTWADDGGIYTTTCDMNIGWQNAAQLSNFTIGKLSTFDSSVVGSMVNPMTAFGPFVGAGSDGKNYKAMGLISVSGVLYALVARMTAMSAGSGFKQVQDNAQIIKSIDHGVTWTPMPPSTANPYVSPMFPGVFMGNASPIQYGQDYVGNTVDNSNQYVYWMACSTYTYDADTLYLARVKISEIGLLDATKWSYYKGAGANGMLDANWDSNSANATPIISDPGWLGSGGAQYIPQYGRYLYIGTRRAGAHYATPVETFADTTWGVYEAPRPWGPWTKVQTIPWVRQGFYLPAAVSKSVSGATAVLAAAGDYSQNGTTTGLYTLNYLPVTINY